MNDIALIAFFCGILGAFTALLNFTLYYYGGRRKPLKYLGIGQMSGSIASFVYYMGGEICTLLSIALLISCLAFLINGIEAITNKRISYWLHFISVFSFVQGYIFTIAAPALAVRVLLNTICNTGLCILGTYKIYVLFKYSRDKIYILMCVAFIATAVMMLVRAVVLWIYPQPNPLGPSMVNLIWILIYTVAIIGVGFGLVIIHMKQLPNELEKIIEMKSQDLQAAYSQMKGIFDSLGEPIIVLDSECHYVLVNKASEVFTGQTSKEKMGKLFWEIYPQDEESLFGRKILEVMKTRNSQQFEFMSPYYNCWLAIRIYPFENGCVINYKDISEAKKTEWEKMRLDRMNLVGQMAAGISHEIRNPMTTVKGFLQLFVKKNAYDAHKGNFELMISELDRANSIITEFLSVSRNEKSEQIAQNLNDIIRALEPLIRAQAAMKNSQLALVLGEIPNSMLNGSEIRQLILNLVINGLEAMPAGGRILLKTYVKESLVYLQVSDSGTGIPAEILNKLGTPFFTTKDTGTGLGLAICFGIAQRHGARIEVDSSENSTTFSVRFPILT